MSGFTASNSRIRVVETVNNVDETVFDTDNDMPHIVGTAYVANQTVDFDNLTQTQNYVQDVCSPTYTLELVYVYIPAQWNYEYVLVPGQWTFTYNWYFGSYQRVYTPASYELQRVYVPATFGFEYQWVFDPCGTYVAQYQYSVDAEEYSSVVNLTALPTDEDGNAIDIDFVIVQATGSRTTAGKDPRFNQAMPTTVPSKTFSFQGSVLLESSGKANGNSWFRRIMSVYPSGSQLKLKIQESVAQLMRGTTDDGFPHINDTRSTYNFNFKIFFGKFRQ
jgi:hypothetical protein